MPINELPATFVQCSSICMRPGAVSQSPLIHARSSILKDCAGLADCGASFAGESIDASPITTWAAPTHIFPNKVRCIFFHLLFEKSLEYRVQPNGIKLQRREYGTIGK